MGLFDFLKKKSSDDTQVQPSTDFPIDSNIFLLEALQARLIEMGYKVERHPAYVALTVHNELEIATAIIDNSNNHPSLLHVLVLVIHQKYFPNGIEENVIGIGSTLSEKVNSVLDNYLYTTFEPILDSLSDTHLPGLDFSIQIDGKEILWHPKLGNLALQGPWKNLPKNEALFDLLKEKLKLQLANQKLNWLRIYLSKMEDGTIIGECLLNNEPWEEGLQIISNQAKIWNESGDFFAQKQFMVFRRCDAYDK